MPILDSLALDPGTLWIVSGLRADLPEVPQLAWDELATLAAASQAALVLDGLGLAADELLDRFGAVSERLVATGQLTVVHGDQAAVLHAVRALHGLGWLARVVDGGTHKCFAFARGSTTMAVDEYLALLLRQALLVAPPRGAPSTTGTRRIGINVHALLEAETASPAFAWLVDRALGSAHILARVGNARGPVKRAQVMSSLVARSVRGAAEQLGKYASKRLRAARPRTAPEAATAVRDRLVADGQALPTSDGSRYYQPLPVRIGVVTDEFLFNGLKDAADVVLVTPDNYRDLELDLFLFVACWNGMEQWPKVGAYKSEARRTLLAVIDHFNLRDVPTVFWSIEDPPHYDDFINVAQRSTHVYTTTVEMFDDYRRDCGNSQVGVMPFGVNPLVHNPIGSGRARRPGLFFAGSWYKQYPERSTDMANVFDGALAASRELVLIDRCYLRGNPSFDFPPEYRPFTYPPIEHGPLQSVQKLFDWCLNFNSVKHSATMFANRVPELQAQGAAVMSNHSLSIDRMYPHAFTVTDASQVGPILNALSPDELRAHQMLGVRAVMEDQTYFEKVAEMCRDAGLAVHLPARKVLVVADVLTDRVKATFAAQVLSEPRRLAAASELTDALLAAHDFVAWWPADAGYGAFYLRDQLHGFKYTHARWVASGDPAHEYSDTLADKRGAMFAAREFTVEALRGELRGTVPGGYRVPAVEAQEPIVQAGALDPARLTVVVAQRDQAQRVWSKCFLAARRRLERPPVDLLILDDGSIDPAQKVWLGRLAAHPGVRVRPLPAGEGTRLARAWRAAPALVTTPYVLFFDADDELLHGALPRLSAAMTSDDAGVITARLIDFTEPPVPSSARGTAPTVTTASSREALASSLGFTVPPLATMVLPTKLVAHSAAIDPDDPVARVELLTRGPRACVTDVRLIGRHPLTTAVAPGAALARLAGAAALEARRLALYDRLGVLDPYLRDRLAEDFRAAYVEPLAALRPSDRAAGRAHAKAALALYQPRVAAAKLPRHAERALTALTAALRDPAPS